MAHQITPEDIAALHVITCGDVILHTVDDVPHLQAAMFDATEPGFIVTVKLFPDQRPYIQWSNNRSQMYSQYTQAGCSDAFIDGTYELASHQEYKVLIVDGVPSRPDFTSHTADNRAWCCPSAKSFTLTDPTIGTKISTYIQVTDRLLIECSPNGKGKVFLWRRQ